MSTATSTACNKLLVSIPAKTKQALSRASGLSVDVLIHTAGNGFPTLVKKLDSSGNVPLSLVSAYVEEGNPESGLLPGIEPRNPNEKDGDGDKRVQAYCFRMCLTDDPENRIPFKKPANYDEKEYELLFRNFAKGEGAVPWINSKMPNRKTDTNNRLGFSTDFIGRNYEWPEASYERRAEIFKAHLDYQKGLMWTLGNELKVN